MSGHFSTLLLFCLPVVALGAEVRWSTSFSDAEIKGVEIVRDGGVRVAAEDGEIASFSARGERLWQIKMNQKIAGIAAGDDGTTYASGSDLIALTPAGQEKWRLSIGKHLAAYIAPIWAQRALYLNAGGEFQCKISPSGEILWKREKIVGSGPWDHSPAFVTEDGSSIVATEATLHKLDPSGDRVWSFPFGNGIRREAMIARGNRLWFATAGTLRILDLNTGAVLAHKDGAYRFGPVALDAERVVVGMNNGNVRCIDGALDTVWETRHIPPGASAPLVVDASERIYATSGSSLHCLDKEGNEEWKLRIPHGPTIASVRDEQLYIGGIRGVITAVDTR